MNISITATINLEGAGGKQNCSCIKFDEREKKEQELLVAIIEPVVEPSDLQHRLSF